MQRLSWLVVVALLAASNAVALPETYVSAKGKDAWPCDRDKPCRTFGRALEVTDAGGTIVAVDSGLFAENSLVIENSVTIEAAPGVVAELTAPGGSTGIVFVNAGVADVVVLRGLTLKGQSGTPLNGIVYNQAHALHVESCIVTSVPTKGILALYTNQLFVKDSVFRGNYIGVSVEGATASIDGVRMEDNAFGLFASLGAKVTVRDSVASGNSSVGFLASTLGDTQAELNVEDCMAANNGTGVKAEAFDNSVAWVRISRCVVTNNTTGLQQAGNAVLESRGNSTVRGNDTDVSGAITPIAGT
jgi:Right handed beta helix region